MNCLIDYILLEGVTVKVTPNSGLYLNRELTIPIKHISGAINNEQADLEGIWNDVQVKGIRKFIVRVKLGWMELYGNCNMITDEDICTYKDQLTIPLIYLLGSELMQEMKHSNRINRFTTIDRARADQMQNEFDSEFQVQLKAALGLINAEEEAEPLGDVYTYVEVLP